MYNYCVAPSTGMQLEGPSSQPWRQLGAMPSSARLGRLRSALLAAPYRLCTTKAELLTEYLKGALPRPELI